METHKNIHEKVENTFQTIEAIEEVKVSPFFKERTLQRIFAEKEEPVVWPWFTPKLQLATLVCFVVLNVFAFIQLESDTYESNVDDFAESYGLSTDNDSETSLFD